MERPPSTSLRAGFSSKRDKSKKAPPNGETFSRADGGTSFDFAQDGLLVQMI